MSMFLDWISFTILSESGRAAFSLIGSTLMPSVLQPDSATDAPSATDTSRARTSGLRFKRKLPKGGRQSPNPGPARPKSQAKSQAIYRRFPKKGAKPQELGPKTKIPIEHGYGVRTVKL